MGDLRDLKDLNKRVCLSALTLEPHTVDIPFADSREREFFIDNLLVQIHSIIEMIVADWPRAMGLRIPVSRRRLQNGPHAAGSEAQGSPPSSSLLLSSLELRDT